MHTFNARPFPSLSQQLYKNPLGSAQRRSPRRLAKRRRRPVLRGLLDATGRAALYDLVPSSRRRARIPRGRSRDGAARQTHLQRPWCPRRRPHPPSVGLQRRPPASSSPVSPEMSASSGRESNDLASARNDKGATTTA
jgi:hypothetical protein